MAPLPLPERILAKLAVGDCWEWTGRLAPTGYAYTTWRGRHWLAHRAVYTALVGEIPDGMQIDHLCKNRRCCNPDHLEPVTQQENIRRSASGAHHAAKTACPAGHPYSGPNLRIDPYGRRKCRTCQSAHARKSAARHAERRQELSDGSH